MATELVEDRCRQLVAPDVRVRRVATGFVFTEGPVWIEEQECLLFSDLRAGTRVRYSPRTGARIVARGTGKANGMTRARDGDLVVCEPARSAVVRMSADGSGDDRRVVATHHRDRGLHAPSDCVARSDGTIWFTDSPAGRRNDVSGRRRRIEHDVNGLYRLHDDGRLDLVAHGFDLPNGLCFAPDESALYVADTSRCQVLRLDLDGDGRARDLSVLASGIGTFDLDEGFVDGLRCDEHGNVWVTGPRGIWILDPEGRHLGTVLVPEVATNLTWGARGTTTVYVTATHGVYAFEAAVRGAR